MELTDRQLREVKEHFGLSPRQIEVVQLLLGHVDSTAELAEALGVSPGSARQFVFLLHTKMGTKSKGQICMTALDHLVEKNML
ncbi:MAG: hypothetical protein JSW66_10760 [Phycisphaerales bacterium]|nr:MAG: hypothetical protein JSW66_10760 [Phycisphaerales bacterium]